MAGWNAFSLCPTHTRLCLDSNCYFVPHLISEAGFLVSVLSYTIQFTYEKTIPSLLKFIIKSWHIFPLFSMFLRDVGWETAKWKVIFNASLYMYLLRSLHYSIILFLLIAP